MILAGGQKRKRSMDLRRALFIAALLLPAARRAGGSASAVAREARRARTATPSAAQRPHPGRDNRSNRRRHRRGATGTAAAASAAGVRALLATASEQSEPPCIKDFLKLREDAQKKANALQAAGIRKASPKEACGLFNAFYAAEAKLIKFSTANQASRGIPPQAIEGMKSNIPRRPASAPMSAVSPPRPRARPDPA